MLRTRDPYLAFARAVGIFAPAWLPGPGVHALAAVAGDATLGADVSIGPFVAIGAGAQVGARTVIFPNVTMATAPVWGPTVWCTRTSRFENASPLAIA
jgi:UDP-3-O-[3-hydroxymyristoyl] glucosamine N-acyltransferase